MNLSQLANPRILDQPVYQPGKPIEQVAREHGLRPEDVCKLASNENPWGLLRRLGSGREALKSVFLYPEGSGLALRQKLAQYHDLIRPSSFWEMDPTRLSSCSVMFSSSQTMKFWSGHMPSWSTSLSLC